MANAVVAQALELVLVLPAKQKHFLIPIFASRLVAERLVTIRTLLFCQA